jgi:PEP-CTERM motif
MFQGACHFSVRAFLLMIAAATGVSAKVTFGTSITPPLAFDPNNTFIGIDLAETGGGPPGTAFASGQFAIFFTLPAGTYALTDLTVPLRADLADETVNFNLFTSSGEQPTGSSLGSATKFVPLTSPPLSPYSLEVFDFLSAPIMTGGQEYALVGSLPLASGSHQVDWAGNTTNTAVLARFLSQFYDSSQNLIGSNFSVLINSTTGPAWMIDADVVPVPEPSTAGLILFCVVAAGCWKMRRSDR